MSAVPLKLTPSIARVVWSFVAVPAFPVIVVGVPVRYIHSHYGITSYYDFEATVQLATEVVRSMTEEIIRSF